MSYHDVALTLSTMLGRTVTHRELSPEENRQTMIQAGGPEPVALMNAQALSLIADGDAEWLSHDVQTLLGRPARSFTQFTAEYRTAFSSGST